MEHLNCLNAFCDFPSEARFLWAKSSPYKQLLAHMIDTGCCVKAYLQAPSSCAILQFLSSQWECAEDTAVSFAAYLASMHDIGKATPQFQMQNKEWLKRLMSTEMKEFFFGEIPQTVRHEYFSAKIFRRIWKQENRRLSSSYSRVISLHHQRADNSDCSPSSKRWEKLQNLLEADLHIIFNAPNHLLRPSHMDAVCTLLTPLTILCDWVASSGAFDKMPEVMPGYVSTSAKIAEDTLQKYGLTGGSNYSGFYSVQSIWPQITQLRAIQQYCGQLNLLAPLTIIEAPMGEGKTEAALCLAANICAEREKRGIYVALPTQATSNQMYGRVEEMLQTLHVGHARLLHGTAFLQEMDRTIQSEDAEEAGRWLSPLRMGLLAENGVGTVDQVMAAVLLAKFSALRLLGLSNKVLIIDEIHAYDAYMSEIICILLYWCRALRIPVILLSATLQDSQRIDYLSCFVTNMDSLKISRHYPLITQVGNDEELTQIECDASLKTKYLFEPVHLGHDYRRFAQCAIEKIAGGGCYCILTNTVKRAQEVYGVLTEIKDEETDVILYHARFPMGQREDIEKMCLSKFGKEFDAQRPKKAILVATQVVEQSLDIDFDGMLTELAPIDLLLQRSGRVHRHRSRNRPQGMTEPVIHVILPDEEAENDIDKRYGASGYVYEPFLLNNTEHLLSDKLFVCVPEDIRSMVGKVYDQRMPQNKDAWKKSLFNKERKKADAKSKAFPLPDANLFFPTQACYREFRQMNVDDGFEPSSRATTRQEEPTIRIAFCSPTIVKSARKGLLSREQEKLIFLASVSIPAKRFLKLDLEKSNLFQLQKGSLKGCFLSENPDMAQIGKYSLINDPILGIIIKEE